MMHFHLNNAINLCHLTEHIMSCYTHKMTIISWPQSLWPHFTLCIQGATEKKYPVKIFGSISPMSGNFKNDILMFFCIFISTQNYKMLFSYLQLRQSYAILGTIILWIFLHFTRITWKIAISLQQYDRSPQNLTWWCTICLWSGWLLKI